MNNQSDISFPSLHQDELVLVKELNRGTKIYTINHETSLERDSQFRKKLIALREQE